MSTLFLVLSDPYTSYLAGGIGVVNREVVGNRGLSLWVPLDIPFPTPRAYEGSRLQCSPKWPYPSTFSSECLYSTWISLFSFLGRQGPFLRSAKPVTPQFREGIHFMGCLSWLSFKYCLDPNKGRQGRKLKHTCGIVTPHTTGVLPLGEIGFLVSNTSLLDL